MVAYKTVKLYSKAQAMISKVQANEMAQLYRKVNESFNKKLVFRIGIDAGFFAEFKYLVHAVIYCLEHEIQLQLYSHGANFGWSKGWQDYFLPFCNEVYDAYHSRLNVHSLQDLRTLRSLNPNVSAASLLKWKLKTAVNNKLCRIENFMTYGAGVLSTSDIPPHLVRNRISIPRLGLEGNYLEVFRDIASMIWRFNPDTQKAVDSHLESLALPEHYAATQIRGGDKVTEVELYEPSLFVKALTENTDLRDVLLLTDDYSILERMRTYYPQFRWFSLCSPEEKGYYNNSFTHTAANAKRKQMERFLAQIDGMTRADFFTGSIAVGPSLFLLEILYPRGKAIDCEPQQLARAAQLSIPERDKVARDFLQQRS